ncbi:MAG: lactoylglutathione lyase [Deltaproteobacteria bacterium]|nr:lactoylglutathione lyase [Deltaproteobacteria bacterium]
MAIQCFSHLGVCVSDLERAERFYVRGLGFAREADLRVQGEPSDTLLDLKETDLQAVYLTRDGVRVELLHYRSPGTLAGARPRAMNELGLTHLSLRVEDLEESLRTCAEAGGEVLLGTRIGAPAQGAGAAFVLDPDGTRIELVETPGDPTRPPGASS